MKEIPLLYSTPMVQAKLAGRKTVTSRMRGLSFINRNPERWDVEQLDVDLFRFWIKSSYVDIKSPYGKNGDIIWGREAWTWEGQTKWDDAKPIGSFWYRADDPGDGTYPNKWKPSIHMPKSAARIWERVVSVRPEQLSGITKEDAIKEGIERIHVEIAPSPANDWQGDFDYAWVDYLHMGDYAGWGGDACSFRNPIDSFESLWKSINGSYNPNTWRWRIETEVLSIAGKPENL